MDPKDVRIAEYRDRIEMLQRVLGLALEMIETNADCLGHVIDGMALTRAESVTLRHIRDTNIECARVCRETADV